MSRFLPGSSDPPATELHRLQQQCDRVRVGGSLQSCDSQDENTIAQVVLKIPSLLAGIPISSEQIRFSNPKLVGIGAFGMVFSCDDFDQEGKRVAVKILRPSRQHDRIARERFQEETRVISSLSHPNIVKVFGAGEIDELPYMITEFADAGSVASLLLEAHDRFTPRQAVWIVLQIANAVETAHSTPILHRDLKPGNILLRRDSPERTEGLGLWPLLTDFGLSKNLGLQSNIPLTFEGEVLGTLSYMSPEQVRGQPLKTQSDLFPLGIILYELAHGQHPFLAEDDFQTRSNIVHSPPTKSQPRSRRVPSSLDAIISKCLQKNPEQRYLHASDLAKDLESLLKGEPISVSPPTAWQSFNRWTADHPIASTFLGTIFCCILAIILLLNREWHIERDLALASQTLAHDRAKISQLFLESMRATNSGINDTILAGQRVLPTALLETLDRQIPLLEDALDLAPDDHLLIRQLEIMYHYKSLCHSFASTGANNTEELQQLANAVGARKKSMAYVDRLLRLNPEDENLQVSHINGQYLLSTLQQSGKENEVWRNTISNAIASAEAFLADHPNHLPILETANKMRLDWCLGLEGESPEECIRLLKEVADINTFLLIENPSRTSLFVYTISALTQRSCLLLERGRDLEAYQDFERMEHLLSANRDALQGDWNAVDNMLESYSEQCEFLLANGCYAQAASVAVRWRTFAESLTLPKYTIIDGHQYSGPEFVSLYPIYYRWLALSEIAPDSEESMRADDDLRKIVERCRLRSELDLNVFFQSKSGGKRADALARVVAKSNDSATSR